MTKRQRAQVVELLRCIADLFDRGGHREMQDAEYEAHRDNGTSARAIAAWLAVPGYTRESALEAAQRVEDHQWP